MAWKTLSHQNVLPLLGVTMSSSQFAMASEWMVNGNINQYLKAHKDVDRFELVGSPPLSWTSFSVDDCLISIARRCRSGIDVYAQRGDGTW